MICTFQNTVTVSDRRKCSLRLPKGVIFWPVVSSSATLERSRHIKNLWSGRRKGIMLPLIFTEWKKKKSCVKSPCSLSLSLAFPPPYFLSTFSAHFSQLNLKQHGHEIHEIFSAISLWWTFRKAAWIISFHCMEGESSSFTSYLLML